MLGFFLEALRNNSRNSVNFQWFLEILGVAWLVDPLLQSLVLGPVVSSSLLSYKETKLCM